MDVAKADMDGLSQLLQPSQVSAITVMEEEIPAMTRLVWLQ